MNKIKPGFISVLYIYFFVFRSFSKRAKNFGICSHDTIPTEGRGDGTPRGIDLVISSPLSFALIYLFVFSERYRFAICGLSLHLGDIESCRNTNEEQSFKLALLVPKESTNAVHSTNKVIWFRCYVHTSYVAPPSTRVGVIYESDFGPKEICVPSKPVKDMTEDESKVYTIILDKDKDMIKLGKTRIRQDISIEMLRKVV